MKDEIVAYNQIQNLYTKLKIKIYTLSLYFKQMHNYYNKYKRDITNVILNNKNLVMLLHKSIKVHRNNEEWISSDTIRLSKEKYYKLVAIKKILQYLIDYGNKIRIYLKRLRDYFYNIVEMNKMIYMTYCYYLELLYTDGKSKNNDFTENLREVFELSF